jgi:sucrose phosphorylase
MIKNKIMLITYADSMGNNLSDLSYVLNKYFQKEIGGLHILPFYPSSADRGFAPLTYKEVDPEFGSWQDIQKLKEKYYLMFDYMINHISKSSQYFQDFLYKKEKSEYKDLFILYKDFWENGMPTAEQTDKIYKRKPRAPYIDVEFEDGTSEKVWCTFDEEQIDLNCYHPYTKSWNQENLKFLVDQGASIIRLDAFAYATKKPDTNCFFVEPDVWDILSETSETLEEKDCLLLPEIHEHYSMQLRVAEKGYYVYDFALPMLVLHAIYTGRSDRLLYWLSICPRKQFTTLDTHDGIGVVDARDLMSQEEIDQTREILYKQGGSVKKIYSSTAYNNLDIYQINCTYYSALGENDDAYLLARAIQFFAPGIPQVYYVGLMAGKNDVDLVEKTKIGRDINRHYYSVEEIDQEVQRPVLRKLYELMRFRNSYPAFDGDLIINDKENGKFQLTWEKDSHKALLEVDLKNKKFNISYT